MDGNINSDRTNHILNQWQVHQAEEQQQQQEVKQQVIKDQLMKYEIAEAPQQAAYTQDAHVPKLSEPAPQNQEAGQGTKGKENPEGGKETATKLLSMTKGPGQELEEFSQENDNLDENALQQFAKQNNVDAGAARVAYFFAKNNPEEQLAPPFESVLQDVPQSPSNNAQKLALKNTNFKKLLEGSGSQLQQLANKLGLTPEQAKQLINQAFVSGQSDDPDVQQFAESLGEQAGAQADEEIGNQTFNRALAGSSGNINTLAQQLGKTPAEVQQMVLQAKADPNANVPSEVKNLAQQTQAQADKLAQEPTIDPQAEYTSLLNDTSGPGAEKVKYLSQQLGMSQDQVKEMLQNVAKNPDADVPPEIARAAANLMEKASQQGSDKAINQAAGKIFDAKVALGNDKIAALAKKLGISEDEVKALLQKGALDPESVPAEVAQLAQEMMQDSEALATILVADQPTQEEMDGLLQNMMDKAFGEAMDKMGLSPEMQTKLLFAKQNPQLASQLDPSTQKTLQKLLASAKESLQNTAGIPQSYEPKSLTTSLTNIGTTTYDNAFENALDKMQTNGELNDQDVAQLRQLHYNPSANVAASDKIKQLFQQIEGEIIPQLRTQLGAPDSWSPKPGLDRFGAVATGELGYAIDKALQELKNNGSISSDQLQQIKNQLAGKADAPQELQELIATLMKGGIQAVVAKYGISPQSIETDAPLSSGKIAPDAAQVVKNSLQMGDEAADNFSKNIDAAKGSPLSPLYVDFLKLSRQALQKCKEFLFIMTAGDSKRAKNQAVVELAKQMNRLEQMKRAFAERDEALEKMAGMKILMIFLMIIMAIIMIILAAVLIPGIVGMILAVIIAIMEIINIALTATDSPAAEAFSYVTMVVEMIVMVVQMVVLPVKAAIIAALKAVTMTIQLGTMAGLRALIAAMGKMLMEMLTEMVKGLLRMLMDMLQAVGKSLYQMVKSLIKIIEGLLKGSGSTAGQSLMKSVDGVMKVAPEMVKGGASAAQEARMAQISTPSSNFSEMFKNLAARMFEKALIALQNLISSVVDAVKSFGKAIDAIAEEASNFCKSPLESMSRGWDSVKTSGKNFKEVLDLKPFKEVQNADKSVTKKLNWIDEEAMKGEGAARISKMKSILGTGDALTQGVQSIAGGIRDDALAESQAIILELDGFLQETAEMLKFLRKCIDSLLSGLSAPMDQIKAISESQDKFWKDMSGIGTGLAQSIQG